jgi:hypothetical protein
MWPFLSRRNGINATVSSAGLRSGGPSFDTERRAALRMLDGYIKALLPSAVDEGSGGALDRVIDAWAEQWLVKIEHDHLRQQAGLDRRVSRSVEVEAHERRLLEAADLRAKLAEEALQAARDSLMKNNGVSGV